MNIEVEGSELIIKNKVGDYVIIPKKYRIEVKDMIKENCHECIDALVDTLPIMEDYAEDGSLYSEYLTNDPHSKRNSLNTNPNYNLPSSFKGSFENPMQLDEVAITAKAPKWLKYRREYVKNNPFDINKYVENRFNNPVNAEEIEKINPEEWRKKLRQEGLEKRYNLAMNYVGEQLIKDKPQGKLSRVEWLNQKSDKEEEIIKRNPKYQSSLWADTKRGFISLVEQNPLQAFQNILNSKDYTNREKREILKDYIDHPIMSKLGDAAKILNPLIVPSKMIQSSYRNNYSFTDALKGKKNDAGLIEDIVTDPLNFVDIGLVNKLSKTNKITNVTKVGNKVLNKVDDITKNIKDLEYAKNYYSKYGYDIPENLAEIAKDSKLTDETIQELVNQHNTFLRGAPNEHMATTIPDKSYGLRKGTEELINENTNALYITNSAERAKYFAGKNSPYIIRKKNIDFTSKNRIDWIEKNNPENYISYKSKPTASNKYLYEETGKYPNMEKTVNDVFETLNNKNVKYHLDLLAEKRNTMPFKEYKEYEIQYLNDNFPNWENAVSRVKDYAVVDTKNKKIFDILGSIENATSESFTPKFRHYKGTSAFSIIPLYLYFQSQNQNKNK